MLTWLPNGDYTQPGTLKDITNAWPTNRGYRPARAFTTYDDGNPISDTSVATTGFSAITQNGAYIGYISYVNSIRAYYTPALDRSRTVGGAYTGTRPFQFTSNFDAVYATNGTDAIQKMPFLTGTTFENIPTTAPRFKILLALGTQLLGFNTTANITYGSTTYAANGSRWWCSQAGAPDNFTPSVAANCATDTLNDQDGEIVAAIELNGYAVVFKRSAIYIGEFIGPPLVMQWRKVHSEFGCVGPFAVTKCDNRLYFMSPSNDGEICVFDGASVMPLSLVQIGRLEWFTKAVLIQSDVGGVTSSSTETYSETSAANDGDNVYFVRATKDSFGLFARQSYCYAYNTKTGRFGVGFYTSVTGSAPLFIWNGAEGRDVGAIICNTALENRCALLDQTAVTTQATYTQYRESYNGQKYTTSAGQAYFLGSIPTASVAITTELPTNGASATMATDGRYTFKSLSAARITQVLTMTDTDGNYVDHEITRVELNIAGAGTNKSAPKDTIA